MTYVKKLVMHGFKSFVKKTEIPFTPEINVVLGPNGSGKSNVSDALCFVLGRLSIKSMRAAKAKNLIFLGSKAAGPAKEASVEIVFENSDKAFSIEGSEVSIKRIVRKNGQSIYKINNHTKTRQEVLSLLAQAGIDPNGFNIILQGEIQNLVSMRTEDRRKIIEEVSGISIYESRKEKSLKELNKTEEKLKEISAILRERTSYLNNLEKERQQALKFKKLEKDAEKYKASIISADLNTNKKEANKIISEIEKKNKEIEKVKKKILTFQTTVKNYDSRITSINTTIQQSTGLEQEKLNQEITNIRANLAGISVNLENSENKLSQILKQKQELEEIIKESQEAVEELEISSKDKSSKKKFKKSNLEGKKQELEQVEEQRKRFYMIKSDLKSTKERINEKESELQTYSTESEFLLKQIKSISRELFDKGTDQNKVNSLKTSLEEKKQILENLKKREIDLEKIAYLNENEIDKQRKLISQISKMDICPVCKSKITEDHLESIHKETMPQINTLDKQISDSDSELGDIYKKKEILERSIEQLTEEITNRESDLIKLLSIKEKENQIRTLHDRTLKLNSEISELNQKKKFLENRFNQDSNIEQKYETLKIEVQEISMMSDKDISSELAYKKREFERSRISLKQFLREEKEVREDLSELKASLKVKENLLLKKKKAEEELSEKFRKLISERDNLQKKIRDEEIEISKKQNVIHNTEQEINNFKIDKARFDATVENLEVEMKEFEGVEIIKTKKEKLVQNLARTQDILSRIGTVNLRSLEVYDSVKKEYDSINDKVEIISKEKEGIMKIIHEIDIKKKKAFLQTLSSLNEVFSRNFSQLSTKGQVSLELENKKEPFEAGVNIIVKTGHGKYFDVTSLSGGEQTIVALSLIFAIQDLNPYAFYILDEIDAALDKRNSERLAALLKKYMAKGQYIVITHNDEIITQASALYGVSMHDGISKITSLKI
jgi:chromosome segregation protein